MPSVGAPGNVSQNASIIATGELGLLMGALGAVREKLV
jgi:hypothetical protein